MPATARKLPATLLLAALLLAVALAGAGAARAAEAGAPDVGATPAPAGSEAPRRPRRCRWKSRSIRSPPGRAVPARFLGLSFEAQAIEQLGALGAHGDLVRLLRSLGPGVLRLGGITADQNVGWADSVTPRPAWATNVIGPAQMRAIGLLARRSGWQVLLTVGMAHYEPQSAAREVAAAHAALGPYLAAVEIGNEPDAYGRHGFRQIPWGAQDLRGTGRRLPRSDRRADAGRGDRRARRVGLGGVLGMGVRRGALADARDADRPPLPAGLRAGAGAEHRNAAQRRHARSRGAVAGNVPGDRAAPGHPVPHRRDQLGVLWRRRRDQQHIRLGSVGGGLYRPGHGGGNGRGEPAGQPDELRRLHAAVRAGPGRARAPGSCGPSQTGTRCC